MYLLKKSKDLKNSNWVMLLINLWDHIFLSIDFRNYLKITIEMWGAHGCSKSNRMSSNKTEN